MSVYNLWNEEASEPKMKSSLSSEWQFDTPIAVPKSPNGRSDYESILNKYRDLFPVESDDSVDLKQKSPLDHPFDFFDEDEYLYGANLMHNNIAHVGDNITKLMQMAQEPWPDNVKLFQPYEVEQILLPDNASCLAVQAFLKMCNLPFEVEMRWNAEFMSPSGRVPFIRCGAFVVSELEPIVQFCGNKGATLCQRLSTEEKAEMRAYMSLITNVLVNAELYVSWLDRDTYNSVTRVRNASVYPWPLGWLQTRSKRATVAKRLKALNWHDKTMEQVLSDVEQCCNSLSQRLGDREYFFGTPTPLDALIYGHVRALLSAVGPKAPLLIRPITSVLLRHAVKIANLTQMKLKPQEDYLISQALIISSRARRPASPLSQISARTRRTRVSGRQSRSRDNVSDAASMFGFKPFAAKQLILKSKDGAIQCESQPDPIRLPMDYGDGDIGKSHLVNELVEEIICKVEECVPDNDAVREKIDGNEKCDFEIIAEGSECSEGQHNVDIDCKSYEILDSIDIKVNSIEYEEEIITIIEHRDEENIDHNVYDGDGIVNEKHLEQVSSTSVKVDVVNLEQVSSSSVKVDSYLDQASSASVKVHSYLDQASSTSVKVHSYLDQASSTSVKVHSYLDQASSTSVKVDPNLEQVSSTYVKVDPNLEQVLTAVSSTSVNVDTNLSGLGNLRNATLRADTSDIDTDTDVFTLSAMNQNSVSLCDISEEGADIQYLGSTSVHEWVETQLEDEAFEFDNDIDTVD